MSAHPGTGADRAEVLLVMYRAMWDNVNRHIVVVWQAMTPLLAALAGEYLANQQLISRDLAAAAVLVVCAWVLAHILDASAWCNRNLLIIANIERELLPEEDAHKIHPYFLKARQASMLEHLRIQFFLGCLVATFILVQHALLQLIPSLRQDQFFPTETIPYGVALGAALVLGMLRRHFRKQYDRLLRATRQT